MSYRPTVFSQVNFLSLVWGRACAFFFLSDSDKAGLLVFGENYVWQRKIDYARGFELLFADACQLPETYFKHDCKIHINTVKPI